MVPTNHKAAYWKFLRTVSVARKAFNDPKHEFEHALAPLAAHTAFLVDLATQTYPFLGAYKSSSGGAGPPGGRLWSWKCSLCCNKWGRSQMDSELACGREAPESLLFIGGRKRSLQPCVGRARWPWIGRAQRDSGDIAQAVGNKRCVQVSEVWPSSVCPRKEGC